MSKFIGLLLLVAVVVIAIASYGGCGPRFGVAKDAAMKKVDEFLGELNVRQKEVEQALASIKKDVAGLREKRIEAQVRVKSMQQKKDDLQANREQLVDNLGKLKALLDEAESTGSVTKNGKEVSLEQLKKVADDTVKDLKSVKEQIVNNDVIASAWAKNLEMLKNNDETSQVQLKKLETQLEGILAKKSALDAMKEAASIVGPGVSLSDKFNDLTKGVDELLVKVDTKWQLEQEKLNDRIAEVEASSIPTIDELFNVKTDISSTKSEIDKLLEAEGSN